MGNDISKRNDSSSYYTRVVDNAIRSATPSMSGDSHVRSYSSLIDSAIRSSTASMTDADFDLSSHSLGISGPENFEITPAPSQQAQAQHDRVASPPPPPNTVNLHQPLLQTQEIVPLSTGLSSRSGGRSAYDTNSNSRNSSASIYVTSQREREILQSTNLKSFSYSVLRAATRNFRPDTFLGEGRFGVVFKGCIDENSLAASRPGIGLTVAVKRIYNEYRFRAGIRYLRQLQHPNLVRLIGYCLEDNHRLLVDEFMPNGSMGNHLFRRGSYFQPLTWSLRMKIALGAAKGLAFLHRTPNVIYRNFKTSNILLDTNYNAKLSDFGLERDYDPGHCLLYHIDFPPLVCEECGYYEVTEQEYLAPEYILRGRLTTKSDVYSFGVVLLEMISGRQAIDRNRPTEEQDLVDWAKWKQADLQVLMDPCLKGQYSVRQAQAAAALARQCLAAELTSRPKMDEVVKALEQLQESNDMHRKVDNAIRSATPSMSGDSHVRSYSSLIDSAIRSSTASMTDADFDLSFHSLGISGPENFEITPAPSQQAQAQHDRVASPPPPPNTVNLHQPLLQTQEIVPLSTGLSSRSGGRSAYDTNSNSKNSSASIYVRSRSEGEILQSPNLKSFSYNMLRAATRNFRWDIVLGEGRFGVVFKGWIDENSLDACRPGTGLTVAVKRRNIDVFQGYRECLTEMNYLGQLQHPNLVRLIGYCLEDDHWLLVYEFMPQGSMENHLFRRGSYFQPLTWSLRMKIALGAAKGLAFLHSTEPKVIHGNFKTSNILLDKNYNAKLSDFGLERVDPDSFSIDIDFPRIVNYEAMEYLAPEYLSIGDLTTKSDVYSFGVVLLEMISGRRALDRNRPTGEQNLVDLTTKLYLRNKQGVLQVLMDPHLEGQYKQRRAGAAAALSLQCLAHDRPNMDEVVKALEQLQESNDMH